MAEIDIKLRMAREDELFLRLSNMESLINVIIEKETNMAGELDALKAQVTETHGAIDSAIVLIKGLRDQLEAAVDMEDIKAITEEMDAKEKELAVAVGANPGA